MIQECPHCFLRVVVTSNNLCPSCATDVTSPATHNLAVVDISMTTTFPQICHACGLTARQTTFAEATSRSEAYVEDASEGFRAFVTIFSFFLLPMTIFLPRSGSTQASYRGFRVKVPCCSACKSKEVRVLLADTERAVMRIAVNATLASALRSNLKSE